MDHRRLITLAALLLLLPAGAVGAPLKRVAVSSSGIYSDEHGRIAYLTPDGKHVVVANDAGAKAHRVPRPAGCQVFRGVSGDRLVFECGGDPRGYSIGDGQELDLAGFRAAARRRASCASAPSCSMALDRVGRQWLRYTITNNDVNPTEVTRDYISISTGEERAGETADDQVADVDAPGLIRTLCDPLRRRLVSDTPNFTGGIFEPFDYNGGYGLRVEAAGDVLLRCGSTTPVRTLPPGGASLSDDLVVWLTQPPGRLAGQRLHVMRLSSGREKAFHTGTYLGPLTYTDFRVTNRFLWVSDLRGYRRNRIPLLRATLP